MTRAAAPLAALLLALTLAACAAVTEPMGVRDPFRIDTPFEGVARNPTMLEQAVQAPALVVHPIAGLTSERGEALRAKLLTTLQRHDIPALTESKTSIAWNLRGQAAFITREDGPKKQQRTDGTIVWLLTDATGTERTRFTSSIPGGEDALVDTAVSGVAEEAAILIDQALTRPRTQVIQEATTQAAAPSPDLPRAIVVKVTGAPGDGNQTLATSLTALLPLQKIKIADKDAKGAWRIEGIVKVVPKTAQADSVTLTWRVLDDKGKEAGKITQENAVPHGRLKGKWGEIASFAAEAASEGIAQLIHSLTDKAPQQPVAPAPAPAAK